MVDKRDYKYPDTAAYNFVIKRLNEEGVTIEDIAKIAMDLQKKHMKVPSLEYCCGIVNEILHKREVLNNAMVGMALDKLANEDKLEEPLEGIIKHDLGVFGVDETLALGIASIYGTIGVTNYSEIDTNKSGIVKKLDEKPADVTTFIDDFVGAVAGATAAKIAHDNA